MVQIVNYGWATERQIYYPYIVQLIFPIFFETIKLVIDYDLHTCFSIGYSQKFKKIVFIGIDLFSQILGNICRKCLVLFVFREYWAKTIPWLLNMYM